MYFTVSREQIQTFTMWIFSCTVVNNILFTCFCCLRSQLRTLNESIFPITPYFNGNRVTHVQCSPNKIRFKRRENRENNMNSRWMFFSLFHQFVCPLNAFSRSSCVFILFFFTLFVVNISHRIRLVSFDVRAPSRGINLI